MLPKILIFPFFSSSCVWACVCDFLDDRIKVCFNFFRGFYILEILQLRSYLWIVVSFQR